VVYRNVGCIAPIGHCKSPTTKSILRGIERVPAAPNVRLEPGMQVHWLKPVKESNYQTCGDADAATKCDTKMGKIATTPLSVAHSPR
jgi:hypothetical protein